MLNTQNAVAVHAEAEELLKGPKSDVSRALRRFLQRVIPDGVVVTAFNEAEAELTQTQFNHLRSFAEQVRQDTFHYQFEEDDGTSQTLASKAKKFVNNQFPLGITYEEASLLQLKNAVRMVRAVAKGYLPFAQDPQGSVYRSTPAGKREADKQRREAYLASRNAQARGEAVLARAFGQQ